MSEVAEAIECPKGLHGTYTWEPYLHVGDGYKVNGFKRSDDAGYVLPVWDQREWRQTDYWWVTWAHPMLCGRPGWHHHAFGTYSSANAGAMAFDKVYDLERLSGNYDRCHEVERPGTKHETASENER